MATRPPASMLLAALVTTALVAPTIVAATPVSALGIADHADPAPDISTVAVSTEAGASTSSPFTAPGRATTAGPGVDVVTSTPARLLDTRPGGTTIDGQHAGTGRLSANQTIEIPITGRHTIPTATSGPGGVAAAIVNITAVDATDTGYVTTHPCTTTPPNTSTLNYWPGVTATPNEIIAPLTPNGTLCLTTSAPIDLLIDTTGWIPTTSMADPGEDAALAPPADEASPPTTPSPSQPPLTPPATDPGPTPAPGPTSPTDPSVPSVPTDPGPVAPADPDPDLTDPDPDYPVDPTDPDPDDPVDPTNPDPDDPVDPTDPEPSDPGAGPTAVRWSLDVTDVIFTEDEDEPRTLSIDAFADDGSPVDGPLPDGTRVVRHADVFEIELLPDGRILVSGSDTIGAEMVGIDIPGNDELLTFWITSYRVKPGVELIPTERIHLSAATDDDIDLDPFSPTEVLDRFEMPEGEALGVLPVILHGPAPVPGTLLSGLGIHGRVISPVATPTLERDGMSLFSVEVVPLEEIVLELDLSIDTDELEAAGLYDGTLDDCPEGDCPPPAAPSGLRRAAIPAPAGPGERIDCGGTGATGSAGGVSVQATPNFKASGTFDSLILGGESLDFTLRGGFTAEPTLGITINLSPTVGVAASCRLSPFGSIPIPVPAAGPAAIFAQIVFIPFVELTLAVSAAAPIGAVGMSCSSTHSSEVTLKWVEGGAPTVTEEEESTPFACTSTDSPSQLADPGLIVDVQSEAGIYLGGSLGVSVGGKFLSKLGRAILGIDDRFNELAPFYFKFGPKLSAQMRSYGSVVFNRAHQHGLALDALIEVGVDLPNLAPVLKYFIPGNTAEYVASIAASLNASLPISLGTFSFPPAGPIVVDIDGEPAPPGGTIELDTDQVLTLTGRIPPLSISAGPFTASVAPEPPLYEPSTRVYDVTAGQAPAEIDDFQFSYPSPSMAALTMEMTEARCSGRFNEPRTLVIASAVGSYWARFPVYLGTVTVGCTKSVTFVDDRSADERGRSRIVVSLNRGSAFKNVIMRQSGYDDAGWALVDAWDEANPYVTVAPMSGTFTGPEVGLSLQLDCPDDDDPSGSVLYQPSVDDELLGGGVEIEYDCNQGWIDVSPSFASVNGSINLDIASGGETDDAIQVSSGGAVTVVLPSGGHLPGEQSVERVAIVIDDRRTTCDKLPEMAETVTFSTSTRGSAQATLLLPEKQGDPSACPPGPSGSSGGGPPPPGKSGGGGGAGGGGGGGASLTPKSLVDISFDEIGANSWGDPHITTFNGVAFDAMVRGEYIYAEDEGFRVVARHQDGTFSEPPFPATSITALAFERPDRTLELYASDTDLLVLVDGASTAVPNNRTVTIAPGFSITRLSTTRVEVSIGSHRAVVVLSPLTDLPDVRPLLAISLYPWDGVVLRGLLGSSDRDPSTDLTLRGGHDSITVEEARAHGERLYEFTDSWRLTYPADSPFTIPSDVFDAPNQPVPDDLDEVLDALLDELEIDLDTDPQIQRYLQACNRGGDAELDQLLAAFAIDLAVGVPFENLVEFGCTYNVTGVVVADITPDDPLSGAAGVHDAHVTVSAPGMLPCVSSATSGGVFRCEMVPDPEGDQPVSLPLFATIEVRPPLEPDGPVIGTGSAVFTEGPTTDDPRASANAPLIVVDADDLTVVMLSGTVTRTSTVPAPVTRFALRWSDATAELVGARDDVISIAPSGQYAHWWIVPNVTTDLSVTWSPSNEPDDDIGQTFALSTGINLLDFSPAFTPPIVLLNGDLGIDPTLIDPTTLTVTVSTTATTPDVTRTRTRTATVTADGRYNAVVELPRRTTMVDVEVVAVDGSDPVATGALTIDPVGPSAQFVTLDLEPQVPTLVLSGTLVRDGQPVTEPTTVAVTTTPPTGTTTVEVEPDPDGNYSTEVRLLPGVTSVTARINLGGIERNARSVNVDMVDDLAEATLDIDIDIPRLALSGEVTDLLTGSSIVLWFTSSASTGGGYSVQVPLVVIGSTYAATIELPSEITEVTVAARVDGRTTPWDTVVTPLAPSGVTAVGWDLDGQLLALSGALTGIPADRTVVLSISATIGGTYSVEQTLAPEPDGTYVTDIALPTGIGQVTAIARLDDDDTVWADRTFVLDPSGSTVETWDIAVVEGLALDLELLVDGEPFVGSAPISYRSLGDGGVVLDTVTTTVETDVTGRAVLALTLHPDAVGVEVAWLGVAFPTWELIEIDPDVALYPVLLEFPAQPITVSGVITDVGVPVSTEVMLALQPLAADGAPLADALEIAVTPDGSGEFMVGPVDLVVIAGRLRVSVVGDARFVAPDRPLGSGPQFVHVGLHAYGTAADQTVTVSGTFTVGGDPWPAEARLSYRFDRLVGTTPWNWNSTLTIDPDDGSYATTVNPMVLVTGGAVAPRSFDAPLPDSLETRLPPIVGGANEVTLGIDVPGSLLSANGTLMIDGAPTSTWMNTFVVVPDSGPAVRPTPGVTGSGAFALWRLLDDQVQSVVVGAAAEDSDIPWDEMLHFEDDFVFSDPIPVDGGVITVDDLELDVSRPVIELTGTITRDGDVSDDPLLVEVTWFDDAPVAPGVDRLVSTWRRTATIDPGPDGIYDVELVGPVRATRAEIVAMGLPVDDADRMVTVADLEGGLTTTVTFDLERPSRRLAVDGTIVGPTWLVWSSRDLRVAAEFFDDDVLVGETLLLARDEFGSSTFVLTSDVPTGADRVELSTILDLGDDENDGPLVLRGPSGPSFRLDGDLGQGDATLDWDLEVRWLDISGTVTTTLGELAPNQPVRLDMEARTGGADGTVLRSWSPLVYATNAGVLAFEPVLPTSTDTVVISSPFVGPDPIEFEITGASTELVLDLVAPAVRPLTITGSLTRDGAAPAATPSISIDGHTIAASTWQEPTLGFVDFTFGEMSPSGGGGFDFATTIRAITDVVVATVVVDGHSIFRGARTTGDGPASLSIDLDLDRPRFGLEGTLSSFGVGAAPCPALIGSRAFEVTVTGFDGEPGDPATGDGQVVLDTLVLPWEMPGDRPSGEFVGEWSVEFNVPDGITHLVAEYSIPGAGSTSHLAADGSATKHLIADCG